ncbi:MAG: iron-sulfur cluster assembly scaffold protein [Thermodesulfobacteriota bacterium]|nr:iron-sulfur cluster assembly scaffold protein [Thermodesulfobacteriota bacterium]
MPVFYKKTDFWQDHSNEYLEMALNREYQERIDNPDGYGKRTGECGDTIEFFLKGNNGKLESVSYDINGCINTNACANAVVHLVSREMDVERAWNITPEHIADFLKTLPSDEHHCAELAVGAFYLALGDLERNTKKIIAEK